MPNVINWFEIPVSDIKRAINFYSKVLDVKLIEVEMMGSKMSFLPGDEKSVSGALIQNEDYSPSEKGVLIYLNGGDDLSDMLDRVRRANGLVIVDKMMVSLEIGFIAIFIDSEGNKIAIHSRN